MKKLATLNPSHRSIRWIRYSLIIFILISVSVLSLLHDKANVILYRIERPEHKQFLISPNSDLLTQIVVAGMGGGEKVKGTGEIDKIPFRWGLEKIHAPEAWKFTQGDENITVAVIDGGVDYQHKALQGRMWQNRDEIPDNGVDDDKNGYVDDFHGWDFRDGDNSSLKGTPLHWHGTFVAGLIGATIDRTGIAGVAPQVNIMDVRFLDSKNRFFSDDWKKFAKAIDYAMDNGADIINLSVYSNYEPPHLLREAIQRAVDRGIIVVGIAGNNSSTVQYPGKYESVTAVTAINKFSQLATYCNFGPEVMVAAPGDRVVSAIPGGKYTRGKGTSFAAPHVSGTIALLLSVQPNLGVEEIYQILKSTSVDLGDRGRDEKYGYGLIDANQALKFLLSKDM